VNGVLGCRYCEVGCVCVEFTKSSFGSFLSVEIYTMIFKSQAFLNWIVSAH